MKGYRTIILNILAFVFAILAMTGYEIAPEDQSQISLGILALLNIFMRFKTDTAVGQKDPTVISMETVEKIVVPESLKKQAGFSSIGNMIFLFIFAVSTILFSGCAAIQNKNPIVDCVDVTNVSINTVGACYSSIAIIADNIDAAADSGTITSDQEKSYLNKLEKAVELLAMAEPFVRANTQLASGQINIVQGIITSLSNDVPKVD